MRWHCQRGFVIHAFYSRLLFRLELHATGLVSHMLRLRAQANFEKKWLISDTIAALSDYLDVISGKMALGSSNFAKPPSTVGLIDNSYYIANFECQFICPLSLIII